MDSEEVSIDPEEIPAEIDEALAGPDVVLTDVVVVEACAVTTAYAVIIEIRVGFPEDCSVRSVESC